MPRKIIGAAFLSLDGVMQAPGAPEEDRSGGFPFGGWLEPVGDEDFGAKIDGLFAEPFDLLLGRRTYDIFAAYWPFYVPDDNPVAVAFNRVAKYVLTRSDKELEWAGSHRVESIEALAALKAGDGPSLLIQGSSTLYPQLLKAGLIDRLELIVAPVVLGTGKRLFGEGTPPGTFRLIEHKLSRNGIQMASFEPAGPVETGSFGSQEPSAPERERRQKIAEGSW
jgi:dihydrofolate reductase